MDMEAQPLAQMNGSDRQADPSHAEPTAGATTPRTPIDELRDILAQAAARDQDLMQTLEELGVDILKELGLENERPVWGEAHAHEPSRQTSASFVLTDGWLRGELLVAVTPEQMFGVGVAVREAKNHTHEATLDNEPSQTVVIDPPDPKDRAEARKKFIKRVFNNLVSQLRTRVALKPE